jgi:hypothetical protein
MVGAAHLLAGDVAPGEQQEQEQGAGGGGAAAVGVYPAAMGPIIQAAVQTAMAPLLARVQQLETQLGHAGAGRHGPLATDPARRWLFLRLGYPLNPVFVDARGSDRVAKVRDTVGGVLQVTSEVADAITNVSDLRLEIFRAQSTISTERGNTPRLTGRDYVNGFRLFVRAMQDMAQQGTTAYNAATDLPFVVTLRNMEISLDSFAQQFNLELLEDVALLQTMFSETALDLHDFTRALSVAADSLIDPVAGAVRQLQRVNGRYIVPPAPLLVMTRTTQMLQPTGLVAAQLRQALAMQQEVPRKRNWMDVASGGFGRSGGGGGGSGGGEWHSGQRAREDDSGRGGGRGGGRSGGRGGGRGNGGGRGDGFKGMGFCNQHLEFLQDKTGTVADCGYGERCKFKHPVIVRQPESSNT